MNRRGVLGALAGAVAAGPSAAKAAAAGLSQPVGGIALGDNALQYASIASGKGGPLAPDASFWRDRLKDLIDRRGERLAGFMRNVSKLDPDLAESRSLSLSAKIRIQAERNEQRDFDEESSRYLKLAKEIVGL